jgi:hypothetical protein
VLIFNTFYSILEAKTYLLAYTTLKPMLLANDFINQLGMLSVYFLSQEIPFNIINIAELVNSALATALHVTCSTIHITLGMTTGGMVFNCDMFLNIPLLTDLHMLQER